MFIFVLRHQARAKRTGCAHSSTKVEIQEFTGLRTASPLEANLITGWKWGQASEIQFLSLRMTKIQDTVRDHRLASQIYLADGLGFKGGDTEKVVYADLMMPCWIAALRASSRF